MVCFLVNLNRRRVESKPEHCRARLTWVLPTLWRAPRQPLVSHRLIHTGLASRASGCGAFGDLSGLVVVELWVVCFWGQLSNSFQLRNSAPPPPGVAELRSWLAVGAFGDLSGLVVAELWVVCFLGKLNRRRVESKPEHCRARLTWVLPTLWRAPRQPLVSHRLIQTGLASRASGPGAFGDLSRLGGSRTVGGVFLGKLSNSFQLRNTGGGVAELRSWLAVGHVATRLVGLSCLGRQLSNSFQLRNTGGGVLRSCGVAELAGGPLFFR